MKMKPITLLSAVLLLLALLATSCQDDTMHPTGSPEIYGFGSDTAVRGDELVIYGTAFGTRTDSCFVLLGSTAIPAIKCNAWTDAIIRIALPDTAISDSVCIVNGSDTTNKKYLTVLPLPIFDMVEIPTGTFSMGSTSGLPDEMPVHSVTLTRAFFASRLEVTQDLWYRVMHSKPMPVFDPALPVGNISWTDAIRFCNALSQVMGYDTCYRFNGSKVEFVDTASGYRLPTEAEWEYTARAGATTDFAGNGVLPDMGWYSGNSGGLLKRGGSKLPNAFGLSDVHGNLREYCWDWFSDSYYSVSEPINPKGPTTGVRHVSRGGAFTDGMLACRLSSRVGMDTSMAVCGIRLFRNK